MCVEDGVGRGRWFAEKVRLCAESFRQQRQGLLGRLIDGRFGNRIVFGAAKPAKNIDKI